MKILNRLTGKIIYELDTDDFAVCIKAAIEKAIDLSYADLSYTDLSYMDLSYAKLVYADLSYAKLVSADLSYAKLSFANLSFAKLVYADLSYAKLVSADLSYAKLSHADLSGAELSYAKLSGAKLSHARFTNATYLKSILKSPPVQLYGLHWDVLLIGDYLQIGCETHLIKEWQEFSDDMILKMHSDAIVFWKRYRKILLGLCKEVPRE